MDSRFYGKWFVKLDWQKQIQILMFSDQNILSLIDNDTAAIVLSHVEYTSGQRYNLKQWSDEIHSRGGLLVVDATQSMGTIPINVHDEGIDVLVAGGYKWFVFFVWKRYDVCGPKTS